MEKIALFADVQNIYYTTRQHFQRQFNYRAFWDKATSGREIVCARAYAIDRGDSKQRGFQKTLKNIGFDVKLKPFIQRSDGSAKGDWDVGITLDAIEMAERIDTLILLSGDGDFDLLLQTLRLRYGVASEVYGVRALTSPTLIQAADHFFPIADDLLL